MKATLITEQDLISENVTNQNTEIITEGYLPQKRQDAINNGQLIETVKLYKDFTGYGFKEAKG